MCEALAGVQLEKQKSESFFMREQWIHSIKESEDEMVYPETIHSIKESEDEMVYPETLWSQVDSLES
ncbi:hypothetical protein ACLOJK_017271 [Asimina triloba]